MKRIYLILFAGCTMLGVSNAFAQNENKKFSVGLLSEIGLPTGVAKQSYNLTSGFNIRLSFHAPHGFATLSFGGVPYIPKVNFTDSTFDIQKLKVGIGVPVKVGYKFIFGHHFFVMGEAGYARFYSFYEGADDKVQSTHSGGFTFAPSAGFQFGALEIGVKYEAIQLTGATISNIGLKLGFNF